MLSVGNHSPQVTSGVTTATTTWTFCLFIKTVAFLCRFCTVRTKWFPGIQINTITIKSKDGQVSRGLCKSFHFIPHPTPWITRDAFLKAKKKKSFWDPFTSHSPPPLSEEHTQDLLICLVHFNLVLPKQGVIYPFLSLFCPHKNPCEVVLPLPGVSVLSVSIFEGYR